jgi:type II restriction/modification system DNA methylase subunit YeeA
MDTGNLKKLAQDARRQLISQVSAKLKSVLAEDSYARRSNPAAVRVLENDIDKTSKEQVIERVAYTWFNRFTALRFMDANRYTTIGVVSPALGQTQPEILAEAKMGHIENDIPEKIRAEVMELLSGTKTSSNPQQRAYKILLVAHCNYWHESMPFLFTRIQDYTELLMPDDLLSEQSIITKMQSVMSDEVCKDVEVIGWLYQFYISEKKDQIFDGLKKNKKVTAENIPAATQLFTPNWIVRYLVENSLGRLWMLNNPNSNLVNKMQFYIKPEQPEKDFLKINTPEEIRVCDPACGSGHMLVYAFDLLYSMYEESGYSESDIPELILSKNLYGIEIDERAGELAAFALTMKARGRQRRFFRKNIIPNICVLENVKFESGELNQYISQSDSDLFSLPVQNTINQFENADNLGSLILPEINNAGEIYEKFQNNNYSGSMLDLTHQKILKALYQADYLSRKYHVVIANPPYMGSKGMNPQLSSWVKDNYPDSKSDLFAMFMERGMKLLNRSGYNAMVTMQSWMFLSSYEKLRNKIIESSTIISMTHMDNMVMGIAFGTSATVFMKAKLDTYNGHYCYIEYENITSKNIPIKFPPENDRNNVAYKRNGSDRFYRANSADFEKIPGSPIAYWASEKILDAFMNVPSAYNHLDVRQGMATTDNNRFLRRWFETNFDLIGFNCSCANEGYVTGRYWFPYNKGGAFRRWYGNNEYIIRYENDGSALINLVKDKYPRISDPEFVIKNRKYYFRECVTWSFISSAYFGVRYSSDGFIFDVAGSSGFSNSHDSLMIWTSYLCSVISTKFLEALNPTLNFQVENIQSLPSCEQLFSLDDSINVKNTATKCISISKSDWDSYETSWDFISLPLLREEYMLNKLSSSYQNIRAHWQSMTDEMKKLEEENNRIFIEAYGLEDELTPDVPIEEITLTCNPYYRYGKDKSPEELEALLLADTMREFISYAVGCMFGRYSLDKPGLILANQGETLQDYLAQVPNPSFPADDDNVIPMLDGDWFTDDIVERFKQFLVVTFGEDNYKNNLEFIENALGKDIRKYFLKEFYTDHVKRYKKRPIYWLFTSPKGTFNALIYMHRYRHDTVSIVLNKYLREFKVKLNARLDQYRQTEASADSSKQDKARAIREIDALRKMLDELEQWEHDIIFPLASQIASQKIEIDLDDGVKVNYPIFGAALKKIPGLEAKDD